MQKRHGGGWVMVRKKKLAVAASETAGAGR